MKGFMLNYLVWREHREVDEDRMDEMIADIGMKYDLGFGEQEPPSKVQNFYRLLATSDEKVHDDANVIVL
jgi:hypothetical protein